MAVLAMFATDGQAASAASRLGETLRSERAEAGSPRQWVVF
jgi:hypothetical protein